MYKGKLVGRIIALLMLALTASIFSAQDTIRIYFIGNSVTGNGETSRPSEIMALAKTIGKTVYAEQSAYCYSMVDACRPEIFNRLRSGNWDYVVLQDDFYENQTNLDNYVTYGSIMVDSVRAVGAIPVSYICWSINGNLTGKVAESALRLCRAKNIAGVPVNMAFRSVLQETSEIPMYVDWIHASKPGGYLAGLTFFTSFFGKSPRNLPALYGITDSSVMRYFQSVSWQAVMADSLKSIRLPWADTMPVPVRCKLIAPDTIAQYLSVDLKVAAVYSDSSRDTTRFGRYRSLNPAILETRYNGSSTAITPGIAKVVVEYVNVLDTLTIEVKPNNSTLDSIRIIPRGFANFVDNNTPLNVTGYFHSSTVAFTRDVTTSVEWYSDTTVFKMVNNNIVRTSGRADTVDVIAVLSGVRDSITLRFAPELRYLTRIRFQTDTVPVALGWRGDNGTKYDSIRGIGWLNSSNLATRADRGGTTFQKSFVDAGLNTEYKIKCPDADYILKIGMGDNVWGGPTDTGIVRFGSDTLIFHTGKTNTVRIGTIRVFGNDGIHLWVRGKINYLVAITKEGVNINDVANDGNLPVTAIEKKQDMDQSSSVIYASPNPFNPHVTIHIGNVTTQSRVIIRDIQGKTVAVLKSNKSVAAWNAAGYPSGIYFAEVKDGARTQRLKLFLLR